MDPRRLRRRGSFRVSRPGHSPRDRLAGGGQLRDGLSVDADALRDHLARAEQALYVQNNVNVDHVAMALDQVDEMLDHYERALLEHGLRRPHDVRRRRSEPSGQADHQV